MKRTALQWSLLALLSMGLHLAGCSVERPEYREVSESEM